MEPLGYGHSRKAKLKWLFPALYGIEAIFLLFSEATAGGFVWIYLAVLLTAIAQFLFSRRKIIAVLIGVFALIAGYRDFVAGEELRTKIHQRDQRLNNATSTTSQAPASKINVVPLTDFGLTYRIAKSENHCLIHITVRAGVVLVPAPR